jgi:hypothetical protein
MQRPRSSQRELAEQGNMYSWLLHRGQRKNVYSVEFQDVARTNALLQRAGLSYEDM